jgi:microcystin-dependent protein
MSEPLLGEIRMFTGNFAPQGWAMCNGQLLPINQYQAVFSILGTTYGGNGTSNFALPDLRGRVPIHLGQGPGLSPYIQGQSGGVENVTLLSSQMPVHNHLVNAVASGGNQPSPSGNLPAIESTGTSLDYSNAVANGQMNPAMISNAGGGLPVPNVQPYLCINFIIALQGIYPSRN